MSYLDEVVLGEAIRELLNAGDVFEQVDKRRPLVIPWNTESARAWKGEEKW